MRASLEGGGKFWILKMVRDEKDKPVVPEPYPRPAKTRPEDFNSWRSVYNLTFTNEGKAKAALTKVNQINDYDQAAAWLDKQ